MTKMAVVNSVRSLYKVKSLLKIGLGGYRECGRAFWAAIINENFIGV